jgi:uncharacterized OsmC-like protein
MSHVKIGINLYGPDNKERAERILEKTAKNSMIINSVKSKIDITWKVS